MAPATRKKEKTRAKMLEAASRGFRSQGFSGIGVDTISKAAGVTSGAFYAHLGSKTGAFNAVLEMGLEEVTAAISQFYQDHGPNWPSAFVDYYLSPTHRSNMACGCAIAALSPDIIRADSGTKKLYADKIKQITDLIADGLAISLSPVPDPKERTDRAYAFLSILIGGLTLARAVGSADQADLITTAIKTAALQTINA